MHPSPSMPSCFPSYQMDLKVMFVTEITGRMKKKGANLWGGLGGGKISSICKCFLEGSLCLKKCSNVT
jgi:hypothetical protein